METEKIQITREDAKLLWDKGEEIMLGKFEMKFKNTDEPTFGELVLEYELLTEEEVTFYTTKN